MFTPRTAAARVHLSPQQLLLYGQDDTEPFSVLPAARINKNINTKIKDLQCSPLWTMDDNLEMTKCNSDVARQSSLQEESADIPIQGGMTGRRAHITLGCVPGVRAVQAGLDMLDCLRAGEQQEVEGQRVEGGLLYRLGQERWLLKLHRPLSVTTLYTGSY